MAAAPEMNLPTLCKVKQAKSKGIFVRPRRQLVLGFRKNVPPTFRMSLSSLINLMEKIPHRSDQGLVSDSKCSEAGSQEFTLYPCLCFRAHPEFWSVKASPQPQQSEIGIVNPSRGQPAHSGGIISQGVCPREGF